MIHMIVKLSGAGTAYPTEAHELELGLVGFVLLDL
jgi:hypothetical protein